MGKLSLIVVITVIVFFYLIDKFLFKNLSKFYINESKSYFSYFKKKGNNIGEFFVTTVISIFIGVLAFLIYKTIMVLVSYTLSGDLIEFFIKNRGVFASSRTVLQNPYLIKNIVYGLLITPLVQFVSVGFIIVAIIRFMKEINTKANDEIYNASGLVYFSTISVITFLVFELFTYSQSITFVSTLTNIILLIGSKLSYILFFLSILHIILVKNENYYNEIHKDWTFNSIEKKLINNKKVLLLSSWVIAIILNIPLYSGFQFSNNNWLILIKLFLAGGLFYLVLMKAFAKGFDFIGVYMIDDTRDHGLPEIFIINNKNKRILKYGFITLILVLLFFNFKGVIFISFFLFVFGIITYIVIFSVYSIGSILSKSNFKTIYIKSIIESFGKVVAYAVLLMLFTFILINLFPKKLNIEKQTNYQRSIIDQKGNVIYFEPRSKENPSSPIDYKELPPFFVKVLLAKEDRGFYNQNSWFFNKRNWHGISSTGRSNINQQLIKNLAFEGAFPQEIQRKFSEFIASYQLSISNSPEDILTHYINNVSFNGGYGHKGIVNASYYTFGRNITNINELEMIYLLLTLHRGNTFKLGDGNYIAYKEAHLYPDEIKNRLLFYANLWLKTGYITKKELKMLKRQELSFTNKPYKSNNSATTNTFLANSVDVLESEDVVFKSSISSENQTKIKSAGERFNKIFSAYRNKNGNKLYASAIVVDVQTGSVLGHYGGDGVSDLSTFGEGNPIGSLIKPFVLLELLEQGYQISLYDGKRNGRLIHNYNNINSNEYKNSSEILAPSLNSPMGNIDEITLPIPLFISVEKKFNNMSIQTDSSIDLNNRDKRLEHSLNYPIGSRRMTIYDIAQAYQVLFNKGKYAELNVISSSFNPYTLSWKDYKTKSKTIYDSQNTEDILNALKLVLEPGGTAYNLNYYLPQNIQFMAKTGTTENYRHGYTVLSDGETLVVSWVSYGKEEDGILKLGQCEIPNKSGGNSAGILGALIFKELYN